MRDQPTGSALQQEATGPGSVAQSIAFETVNLGWQRGFGDARSASLGVGRMTLLIAPYEGYKAKNIAA
jgi:hypothetical protein